MDNDYKADLAAIQKARAQTAWLQRQIVILQAVQARQAEIDKLERRLEAQIAASARKNGKP